MTISAKFAPVFALILLWANHASLLQETNQVRHRPATQVLQNSWASHGSFLGEPIVHTNGFDEHARPNNHHQAAHQLRNAPLVMPANSAAHNGVPQQHQPASSFSWMDAANAKQPGGDKLVERMPHDHLKVASLQTLPSDNLPSSSSNLMSTNLELALRQASGDESVFQPSPTLGTSGHDSFDGGLWSGGVARQTVASNSNQRLASTSEKSFQEANLIKQRQIAQQVFETIATTTPAITTTTSTPTAPTTSSSSKQPVTELNNHVPLGHELEPVVLSHQQSISSHQREYQTGLMNANSSLEFSNQVIYEGPATPPSAASSDDNNYYFTSSSSSLANNVAHDHINESAGAPSLSSTGAATSHSNAWWALGLEEELERTSNLTRGDYLDYCDRSPLLVNSKQRSLCRMHPRIMSIVGRGLRMAMDECQAKFATSRWNCSLIVHSSQAATVLHNNGIAKDNSDNNNIDSAPAVFGNVMRRPNRERSFLNAIIAAGLAHSMSRACSQGELPEECSCDRKIKSRNNKGRIEWVACSDDIDFGARFSREFTDNFDPVESDATATIYMHNSEVGRRVFKSATDITCTCLNDENGLCQMKRCWKHLGPYADVVDELIKRYEGATHVQRSNKDPHKLRPVRRGVRKPKRKDLVYIEESPDYCQSDSRSGVLGTQNRLCNSTSQGSDSCSLLCCGRGFQSVAEQIEEDCNCKFVWCCQVKCNKCKRLVTKDVCN